MHAEAVFLCCRQFVSHAQAVSVVRLFVSSFIRRSSCPLSHYWFVFLFCLLSSLSCMLRRFGPLLQTVCLACLGGVHHLHVYRLVIFQAVCLACLGGVL